MSSNARALSSALMRQDATNIALESMDASDRINIQPNCCTTGGCHTGKGSQKNAITQSFYIKRSVSTPSLCPQNVITRSKTKTQRPKSDLKHRDCVKSTMQPGLPRGYETLICQFSRSNMAWNGFLGCSTPPKYPIKVSRSLGWAFYMDQYTLVILLYFLTRLDIVLSRDLNQPKI